MRSLPNKAEAAMERPLGLRRRPDLHLEPQQYGRERYWLVKDPVSLGYFHLCEEEHAVLKMLDGQASLTQIKQRFEKAFAPLQVTLDQLYAFVGRLHDLGLLVADAFGQGAQLIERQARRRRHSRLAVISNVLAIRLPGLNPQPLLHWMYPKMRWIFSPWFLALCAGLVIAAVGLATVQFHVLQQKLPDFHAFVTSHNIVWLFVALALAKVLHELGHALTCQHVGGQCHEIGLLLLVFTPCLYCDVSDVWTIAGKWRRIAVSAAGIIVEVCLAAAATLLWRFSSPGIFNTLCLQLMIVCSINTLLLNGNPLLRYDGYYVIADLIEVPNLAQQSQALVSRAAARLLLGVRLPPDRSLPARHRAGLIVYGVASVAYRWFVVICILWFCHRVAKVYHLEAIVQGLAVLVIAGMVIAPGWQLVRFLRSPVVRRGIRGFRAVVVPAILLALLIAAAMLPLPFRVTAPVVLEPRDARRVYVTVPGRLVKAVAPGEAIAKGQELARLVNLDIEKEIVELTGQRNQQRLQLENARLRMIDDPSIGKEVPWAESALADIEGRLHQRRKDQESLIVRAPIGGIVLPPPRVPASSKTRGQLEAWQGSPLDRRNIDSTLEKGTLLCLVGSPSPVEAFLVVDQADVNFVRKGQRVRLQLDEAPGKVLDGRIVELANLDLKVVPRELVSGNETPVRVDEKGIARPLATSYQARVVLDGADDAKFLPGTRGRARILADPQSLAQRVWRFLQRTFNLRA